MIAFNSTESNRLMFLIFGALTGVMLLIMICLVVLCVWRQRRRDKHCLIMNNSTNGCNVISCNSSMSKCKQLCYVMFCSVFYLLFLYINVLIGNMCMYMLQNLITCFMGYFNSCLIIFHHFYTLLYCWILCFMLGMMVIISCISTYWYILNLCNLVTNRIGQI